MEDSNAKTIDFLRARLLAERSVSRTARQRAYELAKRVTELEKQLKFVSLQRKKAEKATADVLAILENHGKNDISEPIDSSSNEEEMSSDFMDDKHLEAEGFSGSEVESSSVNGKSLSWKSSKNQSSRFLDKKYMDASRRRRNSFTSTGSSPRRVGKSCRQIRHREHRCGADVSQSDDATNGHHDSEVQTGSEGVQNSADVATETSLEEANMCNGHPVKNNGTEREMKRALKHQAQFIAQYEEEEKAQREWEDKFKENNRSTPENSYDPGSHSDVTEETEETKASCPSSMPPGATDELTSGSQLVDQGVVVGPNLNEKPQTVPVPLPSDSVKSEPLNDQNQKQPTDLQALSSQGKSYEPKHEIEKEPDKLGSVLEALRQAKLSLKQNLDKFPLVENGPSRSGERFLVPFSSQGLFRLPSDYEHEGTTATRANSLTYDPRLSLTNYSTNDPYREAFSRSASSLDDRFRMVPTFPYQETMPEIPKLPLPTHDPRWGTSMGPPVPDPQLRVGPSTLDPRFSIGQPALDQRLGVGPSTYGPGLGVGPSTYDIGQPALDQRLGVGPSTYGPGLGVGPSTYDLGQTVVDPRLGVGLSAYDPRMETGLHTSARLPLASRYGTLPGGDMPLQTRSLYDNYTRPNTYK